MKSSYLNLLDNNHTLAKQRKIEAANKRIRPEKDEQAMESLIRTLAVSMFTEKETLVTVWTDYEDQTFRGKITKLDKVHKTISIENEEEYTWIPFEDVMDIEIIIDEG